MMPPSGGDDQGLPSLQTEQERLLQCLAEAEELHAQLEREAGLLRLLNEADVTGLTEQVALTLREWCGCEAIGIRWHDGDDFPYFLADGFETEFVRLESPLCARDENGSVQRDAGGKPVLQCMCGNILSGRTDPSLPFFTPGGSFWTNSTTDLLATTTEKERQANTRNRCNTAGYESVALIPLRFGGTIYGLLQLNDKRRDRFTPRLIDSLEHMANVLAMRLAQDEAQEQARVTLEQQQGKTAEAEAILSAVADGILVYQADGRLARINEAARRMLAYSEPEPDLPLEKRVRRLALRDETGQALSAKTSPGGRALRGETVRGQILQATPPGREPMWVIASGVPVRDGSGKITGAVLGFVDVTQMRKAQEEIQRLAAEAQATADNLNHVLDAMGEWVVIYDRNGVILRANELVLQRAGRDVLGRTYLQMVEGRNLRSPDGTSLKREEMAVCRALQGETVTNEEQVVTIASGEDMSVLISAAPLYKNGEIDGAVASWRDITDLRRVEQELRTQQEFLRAVLGQMPSGVLVIEAGTHQTLITNESMNKFWGQNMTGVVMSDFLRNVHATGLHGDFTGPEDWPSARALRGEIVTNEAIRISFADGTVIHLAANAAPIRDEHDNITAAVVTATDVTEAVQAQEELRQYRDRLEALVAARTAEVQERSLLLESVFNNSLSSLVLLDTDFNFIRVNLSYAQACGRSVDDFAGHNHFVDYPSNELKATFEEVVRTGKPWQISGRPFTFPDHPDWGTTYWDLSVVPITDPQGRVETLLFSLQDVTERKRAEALAELRTAELVESERKYRELVESANSAIIRWDTSGTMIFANEYAERLFGYEPGELAGKPVTVIIADKLSSGLTPQGLVQAILENPKQFEINENENVTKDGRLLWVSWSNRIIYNEQGEFTSMMAVGTDRTAQHHAEQELVAHQQMLRRLGAELALAEHKERQRLATGLHDDISQVLAFAKMKLSLGAATLPPEGAAAHREVLDLLDEAIRSTRSLITELSPPVLAEKGVPGAVEWALQRAGEQHGFATSFEIRGEVRRLEQDIEITAFQALKEMLNNIVKHAQAAHVTVTLNYGTATLEITVEDDGKGFDPSSIRVTEAGGFGLLNVRERLAYIGGSLTIDSAPGAGTRSTMSSRRNSPQLVPELPPEAIPVDHSPVPACVVHSQPVLPCRNDEGIRLVVLLHIPVVLAIPVRQFL